MFVRITAPLVLVLATTSCVNLQDELNRALAPTPPLRADAVPVLSVGADTSRCGYLGLVKAMGGSRRPDGKYVPANAPRLHIETSLRNQATALGATHITAPDYSPLASLPDAFISSLAYRCP